MATGLPERQAKLRRFQEIVNGDIGLIPLFSEYETVVTRENVRGYVSYPDGRVYFTRRRAECPYRAVGRMLSRPPCSGRQPGVKRLANSRCNAYPPQESRCLEAHRKQGEGLCAHRP